MASSLQDLMDPFFYRGVVAEALGTLFLVFIGCGACIGKDWADFSPTQVHISLCFGLAVATVVWCIGHVSGGHINPAVTIGMLAARKISILRAVIFVMAQCAGAMGGSGLLKILTPFDVQGNLGMTTIDASLSVEQGFGVEVMITFLLVFTVFASCDSSRTDLNGSAPLTIGLSVALCHLFAVSTFVLSRIIMRNISSNFFLICIAALPLTLCAVNFMDHPILSMGHPSFYFPTTLSSTLWATFPFLRATISFLWSTLSFLFYWPPFVILSTTYPLLYGPHSPFYGPLSFLFYWPPSVILSTTLSSTLCATIFFIQATHLYFVNHPLFV